MITEFKRRGKAREIPADIVGKTFGRLVVLDEPHYIDGKKSCNCECSCGSALVVSVSHLLSGCVKSCGCWRKEILSEHRNITTKEYKCRFCSTNDASSFYRYYKTICKKCQNKSTYQRENSDPDIKAKRIIRSMKNQQKSAKNFLTRQLQSTVRRAKQYQDARREYSIDIEYIMGIWHRQQGYCKISDLKMTHEYRSMYSVSIDRIDCGLGYIRGNVQLICKALNYAKCQHKNEELIEFVQKLRDGEIQSSVKHDVV